MVCPNKTNGARRIVNKLSAPASKKFSQPRRARQREFLIGAHFDCGRWGERLREPEFT
jgi:hypothetical protein